MKFLDAQCIFDSLSSPDAYAICCPNCGRRFATVCDHVECWRASSGRLYCSEFCAETDNERLPRLPSGGDPIRH
jgi:hypothetical protein